MAEIDPRLSRPPGELARHAKECIRAVERAAQELMVGDEWAACAELAWMDSIVQFEAARQRAIEVFAEKGLGPGRPGEP